MVDWISDFLCGEWLECEYSEENEWKKLQPVRTLPRKAQKRAQKLLNMFFFKRVEAVLVVVDNLKMNHCI